MNLKGLKFRYNKSWTKCVKKMSHYYANCIALKQCTDNYTQISLRLLHKTSNYTIIIQSALVLKVDILTISLFKWRLSEEHPDKTVWWAQLVRNSHISDQLTAAQMTPLELIYMMYLLIVVMEPQISMAQISIVLAWEEWNVCNELNMKACIMQDY